MKQVLAALFCFTRVSLALTTTWVIPKISLSVTAEKRLLEVIWYNIDWSMGDRLVITNQPPSVSFGTNRNPEVLFEITPQAENGWLTTNVTFDYKTSKNISKTTECYGYWVSYITSGREMTAVGCLKAYATWMNNLRPGIERLRIADLFIPGTHDAGSYRVDFDPGKWETPITKYSLTQDEDIKGQLMHGARYLDIRPAYYKSHSGKPFYVNHGFTRQRPMSEVIEHVRNFVRDTNEFVIFGMKEFPFGFTDADVHEKFVRYLRDEFAELIVDPKLTWNTTLGELWKRSQYVFLAYDEQSIVDRYRDILLPSVHQRWGNVQTWEALESYLTRNYEMDMEKTSTPWSDMAELTADAAGIALDKYGGLRRMADNVNSGVSKLYRNNLGTMANIVAVDFIRGTTVAELAVELNGNKVRAVARCCY